MANKKLTDLTELTTPADNDFFYIVDVSDTTESPQGTSKKIRKDKVDLGASKENIENKQNDLTPDGTGTKYPTVDAVNKLYNTVNVKDFGAIGNGTTDDTLAIQNALNSGKNVFVPDGSFLVSSTLLVRSYQTITGQSHNAEIKTNLNIELISNNLAIDGFVQRVTIKNLKLSNKFPVTAGAGATSWTVNLKNPLQCTLDNVWIQGNFADGDYHVNNKGGVLFYSDGSIPFAYLNVVRNSLLDKAAIRIETSDSDVISSWVWAHPLGVPGIDLQSSNISVQMCNGIIPTRETGGIYISQNAAFSRIMNNFFDGSNLPVQSGWGIISENNTDNLISGNTFWNCGRGGIKTTDVSTLSITGNTFRNNNRQDNSFSDILIRGVATGSSSITATGNTFYRNLSQTNMRYAIEEVNAGVNPILNNYSNNKINGNYLTPSILSTLSTTWGVTGGAVVPTIANPSDYVVVNSSLVVGDGLDKSNTGLTDNNIISFNKGSNIQARQGFPQLVLSANTQGNWYSSTYKENGASVQMVLDGLGGIVSYRVAAAGIAGSPITYAEPLVVTTSGVNLTGTPTAPTAPAGTNTTQIATTAFVWQAIRPYKVYTASLFQTGTSSPSVTVMENSIGNIIWTRSDTGLYTATLTGAFTTGKVACFVTPSTPANLSLSPTNTDSVTMTSLTTGGVYQDNLLSKTTVEIRVYN